MRIPEWDHAGTTRPRNPALTDAALVRFLALTGEAMHHDDDWYAEIRLPVPEVTP